MSKKKCKLFVEDILAHRKNELTPLNEQMKQILEKEVK